MTGAVRYRRRSNPVAPGLKIRALGASILGDGSVVEEIVRPQQNARSASTIHSGDQPIERVVIIGQGYVGLPLAMHAVGAGFDVVGYEHDTERIKRLQHGLSFVEDISNVTLKNALDSGRYLPTAALDDCAGFNVAVITVPTPLREGVPDLTFIEEAARQLAPLVVRGSTVVLESTTYPGTTDELLHQFFRPGPGWCLAKIFTWATAPSESILVTTPGASQTLQKSSQALMQTPSRRYRISTLHLSTMSFLCRIPKLPNW